MSKPSSRIGDQGVGICPAHIVPIPVTITLIEGAITVMDGGVPVTTIGMIGVCSCGHQSTAIQASTTVLAENKGKHRLGDQGITAGGTYTMIQGSPTEIIGG